MTAGLCHEQSREQVRRLQRRVRRLVEGLMDQLLRLEALAGSPDGETRPLVEDLRRERTHLLEEYATFDRQSTELGQLYSASCRLHESLEPEAVVSALRAVAGDLTGCQRMVLYEPDGASATLALTMDDEASSAPERLAAGEGPVGEAIAAGHAWLATRDHRHQLGEDRIEAVAPLVAAGRLSGVLVLLEPLAPAVDLGHAFELLRTHGGAALHAARLTQRPRALQAV